MYKVMIKHMLKHMNYCITAPVVMLSGNKLKTQNVIDNSPTDSLGGTACKHAFSVVNGIRAHENSSLESTY